MADTGDTRMLQNMKLLKEEVQFDSLWTGLTDTDIIDDGEQVNSVLTSICHLQSGPHVWVHMPWALNISCTSSSSHATTCQSV